MLPNVLKANLKSGHSESLHRRIQRMNLIGFLICAMICVLAGKSLYMAYSDELMSRQKKNSEMFFTLVQMQMDEVAKISRQAISSDALQTALSRIAVTKGEEQAKARTSLQNAITFSIGEMPSFVPSVMIRDMYGNDCFYSGLPLEQVLMDPINSMIQDTDSSGNPFWHGLRAGGKSYLIMTRTVREAKNLNLQPLGCIVAVVDIQAMIRSISAGAQQEAQEMTFWLDNQCLYRGELCPENLQGPDHLQEKWTVMEQNGEKYFVTYVAFLQGRVHVINYVDYNLIFKTLLASSYAILIGLIVAFAVIAILSRNVINLLFRRLDKLTEAVKIAEAGDYRVQVDARLLSENDETGVMARHFQNLMAQIDTLVNQKLKREISEVKAQNQMLQAQIRPHFLYNTLETIHAMAAHSGNEQISRMVMSLSRLVRATYRGNQLVPLQEETGFVREYLSIYRIRFGNRLKAQISYDPEDESILLPRMTLQPMVENSIQYGIMKKTGVSLIRLGIKRRGGRIVISLFDNGSGFSEEQARYYETLKINDAQEIHGLANVIFRLRFAFGDKVRVQIHSRQGCWSNICISFQANENGKEAAHVQSTIGG